MERRRSSLISPVFSQANRVICAPVMQRKEQVIPSERIEKLIFLIRGQKVMLDSNLAELYDVPTKVFNQAVKRNKSRFPSDFMFQLTSEEFDILRSQIVTLETGRGRHRKYLPYAFTEQGVAMLSSILRSKRAVNVNIEIMRAFVRLRKNSSNSQRSGKQARNAREQIRCSIQGGLRRDSPIDGSSGAQQTKDRIPGEGTSSAVRERIAPSFLMFREFSSLPLSPLHSRLKIVLVRVPPNR